MKNEPADQYLKGLWHLLFTLFRHAPVLLLRPRRSCYLSGVGMHEVNMFNPVRPGDTLFVKAWWAELKRSNSKPDRGFASIKCEVNNQRDEPVIEYGYRYLLACKGFQKNKFAP